MKRTQIYLPEDLHETLRRLAFEQRRSMADLIREAVSTYVDDQAPGGIRPAGHSRISSVKDGSRG